MGAIVVVIAGAWWLLLALFKKKVHRLKNSFLRGRPAFSESAASEPHYRARSQTSTLDQNSAIKRSLHLPFFIKFPSERYCVSDNTSWEAARIKQTRLPPLKKASRRY
jgi:hypothetical protein